MAYLQALSGIARSGVTYSGWTHPRFVITLGGTTRTSATLMDDWSLTDRLGSPSTCTFTLKGLTPTIGQDVKIRYAAADDYLFGGTLLQADAELKNPGEVWWHCVATGYRWLLGQFVVQRSYTDLPINTIVADLVLRHTEGDFRIGYCPLDDRITVDFDRTTLPEALDQVAALAPNGAWWRVTPDKVVDLCTTYPSASLSLTNSTPARDLRYATDLTQVRTRTRVVGVDTTVTSPVAPGATSIAVAEIGWFTASGSGEAISGSNDMTYTGRSNPEGTTYGPGTITGVSGVTEAIAEGQRIAIVATYDDTAAQSAMAALLGSPASGIITHWITDPSLSLSACEIRAQADVTRFSAAISTLEYHQTRRQAQVGQLVAASVTSPLTISGNYLVQQVTTAPRGKVQGTTVNLDRGITSGLLFRRVGDLLLRIE